MEPVRDGRVGTLGIGLGKEEATRAAVSLPTLEVYPRSLIPRVQVNPDDRIADAVGKTGQGGAVGLYVPAGHQRSGQHDGLYLVTAFVYGNE